MTAIGGPRIYRGGLARVMLRWASNFFFILGVAALGYVSITVLDARLYKAREARRFEEARRIQTPQGRPVASRILVLPCR